VGGTPALKKAIIGKFARENNLNYTPGQIIVGVGAKHVLFNALLASLDPGDEVIIPAPFWVSYPEMVTVAEGIPVIVQADAAQGFKMTALQLDAAITPKTKWLILNSPNNPTGAIYSPLELKELAEVLLRHPHVHIMTDDMYEHLRFDHVEYKTIAEVEPELFNRTLTVNGVSKAYAMTGWRIGYAGGDAELISAMNLIQGQSTTNPSSISQAAAVAALDGDQSCIDTMRHEYERRRNMMVEKLNECAGLQVTAPPGAFYLYVSCAGVIGKTTERGRTIFNEGDFVDYLLGEHNVATVPGEAFGLSPYFRVTFAVSDEDIIESCTRIKQACAGLTNKREEVA
ncbi:MAG: aminotransferase class and family protein, partial [Alphaproteobacteria bacterium]|nr:aminotransferase class and family protein [Alphaproteobacteria bacterium]